MLRKKCEKCVNDLYKHTYIHIKSTHVSVLFVYVCACVYVRVCVHICMYIYVYIYIYKREKKFRRLLSCSVKCHLSAIASLQENTGAETEKQRVETVYRKNKRTTEKSEKSYIEVSSTQTHSAERYETHLPELIS